MTAGVAILMLGLFGVPAALLWLGHRLRRRTERQRTVFWWALAGHILAIPVATVAAFWPPAHWGEADLGRGFAGFAALLVFPLIGAAAGMVSAGKDAGGGAGGVGGVGLR